MQTWISYYRTQFQFSFASGFLCFLFFVLFASSPTSHANASAKSQNINSIRMDSNLNAFWSSMRYGIYAFWIHAFSAHSLPSHSKMFVSVCFPHQCDAWKYICCRRLPNNKCIALHAYHIFAFWLSFIINDNCNNIIIMSTSHQIGFCNCFIKRKRA